MQAPPAKSHARMTRSKYASKRPAATYAKSTAAEPVRRTPVVASVTRASSAWKSGWPGLPMNGMPMAITASANALRAVT